MTNLPDATATAMVRSYLSELESALAGVPLATRRELLLGVEEELAGLNAGDAAERIRAIGEPEFIAAEARAQLIAHADPSSAEREPQWYPTVAALLVAFGGFVVPVLGTVAGIVMVCVSRTYTRGDKLVATLTPLALSALVAIAAAVLSVVDVQRQDDSPLLPAVYDVVWAGIPALYLAHVLLGIWLLVRARRVRAASAE